MAGILGCYLCSYLRIKGQGCRATTILIHCWWECKMVQPLCKHFGSFFKMLKIYIPYHWSHTKYLPKRHESYLYTKTCIWMLIVALFLIAKNWKKKIPKSIYCRNTFIKILKCIIWDFPGDPMVKTLHFICRGHGFDPWSGN